MATSNSVLSSYAEITPAVSPSKSALSAAHPTPIAHPTPVVQATPSANPTPAEAPPNGDLDNVASVIDS